MFMRRHAILWLISCGVGIGVCVNLAMAQEEQIPDPVDQTETTDDGVDLKFTFYPGVHKKHTIPIIIIHEYGGRRAQVHDLALSLQHLVLGECGFAVAVPDMRGHGDSVLYANAARTSTIKYDKLKPVHFQNMTTDIDTVKRFLMRKNNEGELNIEQLCIIGVGEMGSMTAWRYTNYDWSYEPLPGRGKQGQDVKGLVMISPKISYKGMTLKPDHPFVASQLSTMIIRGSNDADAQKLYDQLKVKHAPLPKEEQDLIRQQDLFLVSLDAAVPGPRLLDPNNGLDVGNKIMQFLQLRLVNKRDLMRWQDRTKKQ
ncbi:MAG: alpha/beta hydrolase [Planctomycetes bacterium]|nr:alpha/beta hydrolase [Planctomycetota bacterium]